MYFKVSMDSTIDKTCVKKTYIYIKYAQTFFSLVLHPKQFISVTLRSTDTAVGS